MRRFAVLLAAVALVAGCSGSPGAAPAASTTPAPATATASAAPTAARSSSPTALTAKVTFDGTSCVYTGPKLIPSPSALTINYDPIPAEEGSHLVLFAIRSSFTQADIDREFADPSSGIGMSVPDWVDASSYQEQIGSGSLSFELEIERNPSELTGLFDKWMVSCLHSYPGKPVADYTILQLVDASATSPTAAPPTVRAPVEGTASCFMGYLTPTSDPARVTHLGGLSFTCTVTTDDPRTSGTESALWNVDQWGTKVAMARVQWGSMRLENEGGAWVGKGSGVYSSDRGEIIATWYKGTGGYAGLAYFELRTAKQPYRVRGLIFSGDPPTLTGIPPVTGPMPSPNVDVLPTPQPGPASKATAYGPVSEVTGTSGFTTVDLDTGAFAGKIFPNDPRISGSFKTASWVTDFVGGTADSPGMGPQWGASRITNARGGWQGVSSGVYDEHGDVIVSWYEGTGGYAGMSYFELVVAGGGLFGSTGSENYGNYGLIFPGDPPTP